MKGKITFPPPLFKRNPEDKDEGHWAHRFDPETLAKISANREATKLQRAARAAPKISSTAHLGGAKPKQINLTGSWLGQKVQDQSAAPKGKKATGALEKTTLYPLGVKPFNYSRTKDDEDTQHLALEKIIARQDKPESDKETTGAERDSDEHDANLSNLDDWGLGSSRGTASPLSLLGANDLEDIEVSYSSEEKDAEPIKAPGDKGEQELTEDNILDGGQGDKIRAPQEIINTVIASGDKGKTEFTENNKRI